MTMLSFRVDAEMAAEVERWSRDLGMERSELLRDALRRQLVRLRSEIDAQTYGQLGVELAELALADAADWGPAEDWSDWGDAAG